jgi:hypothetical protein
LRISPEDNIIAARTEAVFVKIERVGGFKRIYQAECFPGEVDALFGKNKGDRKRYLRWLYMWLSILDAHGRDALALQQFEHLLDTESPHLYAIRHPHSRLNERYIYMYADSETVILLTAFKEKSAGDYKSAIWRAKNIFKKLEETPDGDS